MSPFTIDANVTPIAAQQQPEQVPPSLTPQATGAPPPPPPAGAPLPHTGAPPPGAPAAAAIAEERLQKVFSHLLMLMRSGQQQQAEQMVAELRTLGVLIELERNQWQAADGRHGNLEPFSCEPSAAAAAPSEAPAAAAPPPAAAPPHVSSPRAVGLPPPRVPPAQPVSLASVMREQQLGKDGSRHATGMLNPRGEYNCFLNVIVQALWHISAFRTAVLECTGADALLGALRDVFGELSAAERQRDAPSADASAPRVVSAERLRLELSARPEVGDLFRLGDMADAVEAFEVLLQQLKGGPNASSATALFEYQLREQGLSREPPYAQVVLYSYVPSLRTIAKRAPALPFDEALAAAHAAELHAAERPKALASAPPEVFTLGLAWDTARPAKEEIDTILTMLDERVDLQKVKRERRAREQLAREQMAREQMDKHLPHP